MAKTNINRLVVIILIALGLRLYQFGSIPHGINRDEAAIGYTAYLLLNTGKDEHQRSWPLKFESFGDWKQPGYIYLTIPFVWIFGLSEQTVRLPSLLFGLVMMIAAYLITNQLVINKNHGPPGLIAAFLLMINPWHFHFSHLALESMMAAALFAVGVWCLGQENSKNKIAGLLCLSLAVITYHSALIVVPLWFMGFLLITRKSTATPLFKLGSLVLIVFIATTLFQSWNSAERDKVSGTTIFSMTNEELWERIYARRAPGIISALIHNRYTYTIKQITGNYLQTFSWDFLLFKGGTHPHYNVPGFGNFYAAEIGLAVVGVIATIKKRHLLGKQVLLLLVLAPLPAALTKDAIHSTREIFLLPGIQIMAAYGCFLLWSYLTSKPYLIRVFGLGVVALSLIIQAGGFLTHYWTEYKSESDRLFTGYMKKLSLDLAALRQQYPNILITFPYESPYIFYAFYTKMAPAEFFNQVAYYPKDRLGFVYAKSLGNMIYSDTETGIGLKIARAVEEPGIVPIHSWPDLTGATQFAAYTH